jgi:hypothetical protein
LVGLTQRTDTTHIRVDKPNFHLELRGNGQAQSETAN